MWWRYDRDDEEDDDDDEEEVDSADESAEQTGDVAGEELAKLWPDERPSELCDGDSGNAWWWLWLS